MMMNESEWDLSLPVPPHFNINADVTHEVDINFEVKYIFKKYVADRDVKKIIDYNI